MNNSFFSRKKTKSVDKEEDRILEEVENVHSTIDTHPLYGSRQHISNTNIGLADQMYNLNSVPTGATYGMQNPGGYQKHHHSFPKSSWPRGHGPQEQTFQTGTQNFLPYDAQYTSYERDRESFPQSRSQPSFQHQQAPYHHGYIPNTEPLHEADPYRGSSRRDYYQEHHHASASREQSYNNLQDFSELKWPSNQKYPPFPGVNETPITHHDDANKHYTTLNQTSDKTDLKVCDRSREEESDLKVEAVVGSIPTSPIQSIQNISKSRNNTAMSLFRRPMAESSTEIRPQTADEGFSGKNMDKRDRKNMQSRLRAAKLRERVAKIKEKPEMMRTEEEVQILNNFEIRRFNKNRRSKNRAEEKKKRINEILKKPEALRTEEEKNFIEVSQRARLRKNESDRRRRRKIKMMGLSIQSSKSSLDSSLPSCTDSDYQTQSYDNEEPLDPNLESSLDANQTTSTSNQIDFNDFFQGNYLGEASGKQSGGNFNQVIDKDDLNIIKVLKTSANNNTDNSRSEYSSNYKNSPRNNTFTKYY